MKSAKRWRPLLAVAALLASSAAMAASVTPIAYPGNLSDCDDIPGVSTWDGLGLSTGVEPVNGQTYDLGGGHSVTFTYNANDPKLINFSATLPLDYVVVKGGPNYNVYHYVPPEDADTDLTSPLNDGKEVGVSHVVVCFKPRPTGSKTAAATWDRFTDWTVDKTVTPQSITMFDGDSHAVRYTVTVTPAQSRGQYRVAGNITVRDPFAFGWNVKAVVDTLQFNNNATQFQKVWDGPGGQADTMTCTVPPQPDPGKVIMSCSYAFDLHSNAHPFLLSATGGVNAAGITTSKPSVPDYTFATTANFAIGAPANSYGDTINVVDVDDVPGDANHEFTLGGNYVWTYGRNFTCGRDEGQHDNTATGTWSTGPGTTGSDNGSASVDVNCEDVDIEKTAEASFNRDYAWNPDKRIVLAPNDAKVIGMQECLPDPIAAGDFPGDSYVGGYLCRDAELRLNPGDTYDTVYLLKATKTTQSESDFVVAGTIVVTWPAGLTPIFTGNPVDTLYLSDSTTQPGLVNCGAQAATSLSCTYSATLPSKLTGDNRATITRNKQCYTYLGVASNCGTMDYSDEESWAYGDPAVETDACVTGQDLFNSVANLNGGAGFGWLLGERCSSFAEFVTGDVGNGAGNLDILASWILPAQTGEGNTCEFLVPNTLRIGTDDGATKESTALASVNVPLLCVPSGCTYTQGYWKTHVDYYAKPQFAKKRDSTWDLIDGAGAANEDAPFFGSGMSYIEVMWTPPKGNAYFNLAHQYIAAKLNVLDGASDTAVAADLVAAEAMLANLPTSNYWKNKTNRQDALELAGRLGAYNEGETGPGHCSVSMSSLQASR